MFQFIYWQSWTKKETLTKGRCARTAVWGRQSLRRAKWDWPLAPHSFGEFGVFCSCSHFPVCPSFSFRNKFGFFLSFHLMMSIFFLSYLVLSQNSQVVLGLATCLRKAILPPGGGKHLRKKELNPPYCTLKNN